MRSGTPLHWAAPDKKIDFQDWDPVDEFKTWDEITFKAEIKYDEGLFAKQDTAAADEEAQQDSTDGGDDAGEYTVSGFRLFIIIGPILLMVFVAFLFTTSLPVAIPNISNEFDALQDIGWYVSANTLASAIITPLTGPLYRYCNPKWCLVFFFLLYIAGSAICGAARSSEAFIVGRAVMGLAVGGIPNGALVIIAALVPLGKRPVYIATFSALTQIGSLLGPIIVGSVTDNLSWRWNFYLAIPGAALAAILLAPSRVPDPTRASKPPPRELLRHAHRYFDPVGLLLSGAALASLILGLELGSRGGSRGWRAPATAALLASAGVGAALFVAWSARRGEAAIFPVSVLRRRRVCCAALSTALVYGALVAIMYFLPLYFQGVRGDSATQNALWTMPATPAFVVVVVVYSVVLQRWGFFQASLAVGNAVHIVALMLMTTFSPTTPPAVFILVQCLAAGGRGIILQAASLSPEHIPYGQPLLAFGQQIMSSVAATGVNALFRASLEAHLGRAGVASELAGIVLAGGATGFRSVVPKDRLAGVVDAYNASARTIVYFGVAFAVLLALSSVGMGRVDVRRKAVVEEEGARGRA